MGHSSQQTLRNFSGALQSIADHPFFNNVILSGGDPLTLSTRVLQKRLTGLAEIPHVDFVRIGTSVPVTHPLRLFDNALIDILRQFADRWLTP